MSALEARLKKLEARRANRRRKTAGYVFIAPGQTYQEAATQAGFTEDQFLKLTYYQWKSSGIPMDPPLTEIMGRIPPAGPPMDPIPVLDDPPKKRQTESEFWARRIEFPKEVF
jgi:hypothetical protein